MVVVDVLEAATKADDPGEAIRMAYERGTRELSPEDVHLAFLMLVSHVATDRRLGRDALAQWISDRRFSLIVDHDDRGGAW